MLRKTHFRSPHCGREKSDVSERIEIVRPVAQPASDTGHLLEDVLFVWPP